MTAPGAPDRPTADAAARDLALAAAIVGTALSGVDARAEAVLGVPAVRVGDRVVARVVDGALLLAPSDAVLPPPPAGVATATVRPWAGAQPHLRVDLGSPAAGDVTAATATAATADAEAAAWIRTALLATAERVPALRLPEPPARVPNPRRPRP